MIAFPFRLTEKLLVASGKPSLAAWSNYSTHVFVQPMCEFCTVRLEMKTTRRAKTNLLVI